METDVGKEMGMFTDDGVAPNVAAGVDDGACLDEGTGIDRDMGADRGVGVDARQRVHHGGRMDARHGQTRAEQVVGRAREVGLGIGGDDAGARVGGGHDGIVGRRQDQCTGAALRGQRAQFAAAQESDVRRARRCQRCDARDREVRITRKVSPETLHQRAHSCAHLRAHAATLSLVLSGIGQHPGACGSGRLR
jgi:hypothetical protein